MTQTFNTYLSVLSELTDIVVNEKTQENDFTHLQMTEANIVSAYAIKSSLDYREYRILMDISKALKDDMRSQLRR